MIKPVTDLFEVEMSITIFTVNKLCDEYKYLVNFKI